MEQLKPSNYTILLFDDDIVFYQLLRSDLESFSYLVHQISLESFEKIDFKKYDAILVDLDIGQTVTGEDLISFFKKIELAVPVIVLSADENQTTKLRLLKMGIDDYLWKSMHKEEIKVRIENAIIRRKETSTNRLGNLVLNRSLNLLLDSKIIESSKIEFKFLDIVIAKFPGPASVFDLQNYVWNLDHVNKGTINTLVWNLNKKLSEWDYRITFQQDLGIILLKK